MIEAMRGPWREVRTEFHQHGINRVQRLDTFRDHMRDLQNRGHRGWSPTREMKLALSVPNIMAEKWAIEDGVAEVFMQWPAAQRYEWLRRKCIEHDCSDFLLEGGSDFRVAMQKAPRLTSKAPAIIV